MDAKTWWGVHGVRLKISVDGGRMADINRGHGPGPDGRDIWRTATVFMKNSLSYLFLCGLPALLSSCQLIPPASGAKPFGELPPGIIRSADGTLILDPRGVPPGQQAPASAPRDVISYWSGEPGNGPARIRIVLSEQTAYFFKGDTLVGKSWLSTGDENHRSPTGSFRIMQKDKWHKSSRYGVAVDGAGNVVDGDVDIKKDKLPAGTHYEGAKMTNFMRLNSEGVGMHAGFLPGYPASHGCIRMPEHMSEHFFNNVTEGTPVTIVP